MLIALATETNVTLCPQSYTVPIFTYLLKLYWTLKSTEKKYENLNVKNTQLWTLGHNLRTGSWQILTAYSASTNVCILPVNYSELYLLIKKFNIDRILINKAGTISIINATQKDVSIKKAFSCHFQGKVHVQKEMLRYVTNTLWCTIHNTFHILFLLILWRKKWNLTILHLKIISNKSYSASHPATFIFKFQATIHVDFYDASN